MTNSLYLDIETIPSQSPDVHALIAETITCPGNISKPESIAAWERDKKPSMVKDAVAKTSFDGALGHVCCIGWAWDNEEPTSVSICDVGEESAVFSAAVQSIIRRAEELNQYEGPAIVGHNVSAFDIRFLWQRAIILGVQMPWWFPRDPKPWDQSIFDTMTAFAGARGTISMDRLARAMGFAGKGDVDGSMVAQMWADGKHDEIAAYCRSDVAKTRQIHRKMLVAFGED